MAHGFTLLETLLVVFIFGIIASVALPDLSGSNAHNLDRAAEELAMGLRFARDESVRTGEPHAFSVNGTDSNIEGKRIRVYKVNMVSPLSWSDLSYHPASKQLFDYIFYDQVGGVRIVSSIHSFSYHKNGIYAGHRVFFDKQGKPFLYGINYALYHHGQVDLEYKGLTKSVLLEAGGRVSIQ